jgi:hypothetical protein
MSALEEIDANEAREIAQLEHPPDQPEAYPGQNEVQAQRIRDQRTRYADLRAAEAERWQLEVVTFEKDGLTQTLSGTPDQVMTGIDAYVVQGLRLRAPAYGRAVSVTLSFRRFTAVSLDIEATDPGWVRKATATLESEIQRGVPPEAQLRQYKWTIPTGAVIISALLLIAFRSIIGSGKNELPIAAAIPLAALAGITIATVCAYGLEAYIPGFELLPSGKEPRGRRLAAVVASFIIAAILGTILVR